MTENGYDVDSRLVRVSSPEGTVNYEYDEVTNRLERTFTANNDTRHAYDQLGRLKSVTIVKRHGATLATPEEYVYTYTAVGSRESLTYPNGVVTEWEFDDLNRLTTMTNTKVDVGGDTLLSSYAYTLAPNGRRTGVVETRREADTSLSSTGITWSYDALNRLVSEASGSTISERSFTTTYEYDITGNRLIKATNDGVDVTAVAYAVDDNDRLIDEIESVNEVEVAATVYGYSDNGEQTSKVRTGDDAETSVFGYNLDGRLGTASIQRSEGGVPVDIQSDYVYSSSGIRARADSKVTNLDTQAFFDNNRRFLIDANNRTGFAQVLEEVDASGVSPVLKTSYVLADDVLGQERGSGVSHFLMDGQGSNRVLTDGGGAVTDRFDFTAYGERLGFESGALSPAASDIQFTGEQFDSDLQLGYHRARYLDHSTGTWNRVDPFGGNQGDPQSLHKYAYVHGNPVNMLDPSGLLASIITFLARLTVIQRLLGLLIIALVLIPVAIIFSEARLDAKHGIGSSRKMNAAELNSFNAAIEFLRTNGREDIANSASNTRTRSAPNFTDPDLVGLTIKRAFRFNTVYIRSSILDVTNPVALPATEPAKSRTIWKRTVNLAAILLHEDFHASNQSARQLAQKPASEIAAYGVEIAWLNELKNSFTAPWQQQALNDLINDATYSLNNL